MNQYFLTLAGEKLKDFLYKNSSDVKLFVDIDKYNL